MTRPNPADSAPVPSDLQPGRVVADFGRHVLVEDEQQRIHPCTVRGRTLRTVCGDRILWRAQPRGGRGVVESCLPRVSELTRPDDRGRVDVIAANIDQLIVVCALAPPPDLNLVDRYLVAAAFMDIAAVIVCNKIELSAYAADPACIDALSEYESIPYPVVRVSAATGQGLEDLANVAIGHTSVLVGQSGVGKSSLLNALRPSTDASIGALSTGSGEGTHTTRASRLYELPGGGELIDSPGVREYTPHLERKHDPAVGYLEFTIPARECRFRNCLHLNEPDCGVKSAVASGVVSTRRYESYRRLAQLHAQA